VSFEDTTPRFGCYGDAVARTPNLDRLAAEGCRFPNAFCTAPVCAPSRSAIITGMWPMATGAHHMRTTHQNEATPQMATPYSAVVPHYAKCFPEYMRAAGYFCTNNAKTDYQFDPPVTAWDWCRRGAHWRRRADGQPFFAVFNLENAHESGMWEEKGGEPTTDPGSVELPPYLPDTPECRKALARQYDNIARNDERLGGLLAELEEDSETDNTVVFIWSDHGEGLPRSKRWPYDTGIRIPLIVRWPGGLEPGTVDERLVSLIDLGPTVLSLVGVPVPAHMHGRPFLGAKAATREYVYATRDRLDEAYDMVRAVRDRRYKYIRNFLPHLPRMLWIPYRNRHAVTREIWRCYIAGTLEGPQRWFAEASRPPEELYDLERDPWELNNLAGDPGHADVLERMRDAMQEWRERVGDLGEMDEVHMKRLWYPDGPQPTTAPVVFVPISDEADGTQTSAGGSYAGPVVLQMHCPTQGASLAYTLDGGEDPHWLLYHEPVRLPEGTTTVRAKAVRIGYRESDESCATFTVT
jgi:N-sulfoglucosamine sulfohydrolase